MKILSICVFVLSSLVSCRPQTPKNTKLIKELDFFRKNVADSLKYLLPILDSVLSSDQKYREGNNPVLLSKHKKEIRQIDSVNIAKVIPIIEKYGVLSMKEIGMVGHMAITITIQHSTIETQKKYLPHFKEALRQKKIMPSTYAMLEDRVLMKSGKMQIYGTQVMINNKNKEADLFPIISPDSIDIRRKSIGMVETIGEYVKHFGITWNLEEYKKQLPALKLKYKIVD